MSFLITTRSTAIDTSSFENFRTSALQQGFDDVLVREWQPHQQVGEHQHPFAVVAHVVRGSFTLACDGQSRHLQAGQGFELALGVPHSEHYGPEGATFWVARRNAAA